MKKSLLGSLVLFACLACLPLGACSSDVADQVPSNFAPAAYGTTNAGDGSHLELRFAPGTSPARGANAAELTITTPAGAPRDGLVLTVVPWMPSHGHGSSVVTTVTAKGTGKYVVDGLQFFMPGRWELRVAIGEPASDVVFTFDVP